MSHTYAQKNLGELSYLRSILVQRLSWDAEEIPVLGGGQRGLKVAGPSLQTITTEQRSQGMGPYPGLQLTASNTKLAPFAPTDNNSD